MSETFLESVRKRMEQTRQRAREDIPVQVNRVWGEMKSEIYEAAYFGYSHVISPAPHRCSREVLRRLAEKAESEGFKVEWTSDIGFRVSW